MKTAKLEKEENFQIWREGFDTFLRWFFRQIHIVAHRKSVSAPVLH